MILGFDREVLLAPACWGVLCEWLWESASVGRVRLALAQCPPGFELVPLTAQVEGGASVQEREGVVGKVVGVLAYLQADLNGELLPAQLKSKVQSLWLVAGEAVKLWHLAQVEQPWAEEAEEGGAKGENRRATWGGNTCPCSQTDHDSPGRGGCALLLQRILFSQLHHTASPPEPAALCSEALAHGHRNEEQGSRTWLYLQHVVSHLEQASRYGNHGNGVSLS